VMLELHQMVAEHQGHFGPASTPLLDHRYRLSEDDAILHGACYVHYFRNLSVQYKHFKDEQQQQQQQQREERKEQARRAEAEAEDGAAAGAAPSTHHGFTVRWNAFPVIPQTQVQSAFIDINASGIVDLIALSQTVRAKQYVLDQQRSFTPELRAVDRCELNEVISRHPSIDWIKLPSSTKRFAAHHPSDVLDQFL